MLTFTNEILEEITNELMAGTKVIMDQYKLGGSDMIKDASWEFESYQGESNAFIYYALDYFKWVALGRKPRARKVPVEALIKWMKKKGIQPKGRQTYNSVAFAIQNGIYKSGIKARNYVDPIVEFSLNSISEFIVVEFSILAADEIVKAIEQVNQN
jgi:hypothetical protein